MALDVVVESLDNVPEALRGEYEERDGKFVLGLNGAFSTVDRDALQRALGKEREEHKTTRGRLTAFGEATPESVESLRSSNEELQLQIDAAGGTEEERKAKNDELAEHKANAKIKPLERQFKNLQTEFETVTGERDTLRKEKVTRKIVAAATDAKVLKDAGIVADAVEDIELWALRNFEVDDATGAVISKESLGTPGLSPKDVYADMKQANQRRHWFGPTVGAGATGGKPSGETFEKNPFAEETYSMTRIMAAVKQDEQRAIRMAKSAHTKEWDALKFLPKRLREA